MNALIDRNPVSRRVALRTPFGFLAFGFGSGLSRYAPGTVGTLVAVPPGLLLKQLPPAVYALALLAAFVAGVYLCGAASRALSAGSDSPGTAREAHADPGGIVWDEMVGFWLTVAVVPVSWSWWLAAFVLFRLFDIFKPWPIRWFERRFSGGLGIMADDVVAALYALALLAVARYLVWPQ